MTTEEDFQKHLDAHPDDHDTRRVFADWLDERGDPRAEGYRALGVLNRIPNSPRRTVHYWLVDCEPCNEDHYYKMKNHNGTLPKDWFQLVSKYKDYETRKAAEDKAALAFAKLPEERKREILNQNTRGIKFTKELGKVLKYEGEELRTHYDNLTSAIQQKKWAKLPFLARKVAEQGKSPYSYALDFHTKHLDELNRQYKEAHQTGQQHYIKSTIDLLRKHFNIPSYFAPNNT